MGNRESMRIEDNDDAWTYKSLDAKLDGSSGGGIFFKKVKN